MPPCRRRRRCPLDQCASSHRAAPTNCSASRDDHRKWRRSDPERRKPAVGIREHHDIAALDLAEPRGELRHKDPVADKQGVFHRLDGIRNACEEDPDQRGDQQRETDDDDRLPDQRSNPLRRGGSTRASPSSRCAVLSATCSPCRRQARANVRRRCRRRHSADACAARSIWLIGQARPPADTQLSRDRASPGSLRPCRVPQVIELGSRTSPRVTSSIRSITGHAPGTYARRPRRN